MAETLEQMVRRTIGDRMYAMVGDELVSAIRNAPETKVSPDYINFRNGLLHIPTLTLRPHTPEIFVVGQIPEDYDPEVSIDWYRRKYGTRGQYTE